MSVPQWLSEFFRFLFGVLAILVVLLPAIAFIVFCLFAIHWRKMWAALREGAWIPLVLLLVLVALLWSQIAPRELSVFGYFSLPNFWWQLSAALFVAGIGLFIGWIQDRYGWYPQEVPVEPPQHAHVDHGHDGHHGHPDDHDTPALD